jgi:hypothetical protein
MIDLGSMLTDLLLPIFYLPGKILGVIRFVGIAANSLCGAFDFPSYVPVE